MASSLESNLLACREHLRILTSVRTSERHHSCLSTVVLLDVKRDIKNGRSGISEYILTLFENSQTDRNIHACADITSCGARASGSIHLHICGSLVCFGMISSGHGVQSCDESKWIPAEREGVASHYIELSQLILSSAPVRFGGTIPRSHGWC